MNSGKTRANRRAPARGFGKAGFTSAKDAALPSEIARDDELSVSFQVDVTELEKVGVHIAVNL
jgi:hypothetical protein